MGLSEEQDRLKEIITTGIAIDVFDAEESLSLSLYIAGNAEKINDASFGPFFGAIQRYLDRQLILSTVKIFEEEKGRYKIKSIPSALKLMKNNAEKLEILEKLDIEKLLGIKVNTNNKDSNITKLVADHFLENIPNKNVEKLKTVRDKRIAHHEIVVSDSIKSPTYNEIGELIDFAKDFLGAVGMPYARTAYKFDDGSYYLSSDANKAKRCLERMTGKLDKVLVDSFNL